MKQTFLIVRETVVLLQKFRQENSENRRRLHERVFLNYDGTASAGKQVNVLAH